MRLEIETFDIPQEEEIKTVLRLRKQRNGNIDIEIKHGNNPAQTILVINAKKELISRIPVFNPVGFAVDDEGKVAIG